MIKTVRYYTYIFTALTLLLFQSCKKRKAENSIQGSWVVNTSQTDKILDQNHPLAILACGDYIDFSGEFFIDDNNNGHAFIYGGYCDTIHLLFSKNIENFRLLDHSADFDLDEGHRLHWYQGYFNDDIYFDCKSLTDRGVINKKTSEIMLNIGGLIDQSTGSYLEDYSLSLVLNRQ